MAVIDGSGSIGACEFKKGTKALSYLMDSAKNLNPTVDTKYAAITFATSVTVNFKFLQYVEAAKKVKTISYPSGLTNTQAGLEEAMKLFANPLSSGTVSFRAFVGGKCIVTIFLLEINPP